MERTAIMTVPEVADWLKLSKSKIHQLVETGQLKAIHIDRSVRIRCP